MKKLINNKTIIQVSLALLIVLSLIVFYNSYFTKDKIVVDEIEIDKNLNTKDINSNLIYDLKYNSTDIDNNEYIIMSESGEMSQNGSEFFMNNVNAIIILNDKSEIIILSDHAIYNNNNFNTKFYGNVTSKYGEQTIFSQKMDLNFDKGLATIYENVLYQNLNTKINTDNIQINLETKDVLMSMNDKTKKININSKF